MHIKLTDRSRKAFELARQEATKLNHEEVTTADFLLGLIKEGSGVAANVLKNLDVGLGVARSAVEVIITSSREKVTAEQLPVSARANKLVEYAWEEAQKMGHNYIGTEHILLALLWDEECTGVKVLKSLGINPAVVRQEVLNLLGWGEETKQEGDTPDLDAKTVLEGVLESAGKDQELLPIFLEILNVDCPFRRVFVALVRELIVVSKPTLSGETEQVQN